MTKTHEDTKPNGFDPQPLSRKGSRHAQILADIAAKVVQQHRQFGFTDDPIVDTMQDLQTRIAEAAAADHTPDWDWKIDQKWQR